MTSRTGDEVADDGGAIYDVHGAGLVADGGGLGSIGHVPAGQDERGQHGTGLREQGREDRGGGHRPSRYRKRGTTAWVTRLSSSIGFPYAADRAR